MKVAVVGLGFGDEGKGMFVDYLSKDFDLCRRFSGGHQVGHMVNSKEYGRHVFSNFGSGTLNGVPTFWDKMCTVDPSGFMREYELLGKENEISPLIYIHNDCPITTPYDKIANIKYSTHGTVGVGFGKTLKREKDLYSLKFIDLFYKNVFYRKLEYIADYYGFDDVDCEEFLNDCESMINLRNIWGINNDECFRNLDTIYEGSQGLMLDPKIGFFPHCTPSDLIPPKGLDNYYFITRAYCTRHGKGHMPNQNLDFPIKVNPNEVNIGGIQGNFRRSMLDVEMLEYALDKSHLSEISADKATLVVTCLDHLDEFCFTHEGRIIKSKDRDEFLENMAYILGFKKVMFSDGDTREDVHKFS